MESIKKHFKDYASYHRTPGNKICHYIGVPLLTMTLLGLLGAVSYSGGYGSFRLDLGMLLWLFASVWCVFLDWRLGLPFSLVTLGSYFVGRAIPISILWVLFIMGWVVQFVGHGVYEKKSPAFFKRAFHLIIGPLWVFAKMIGYQSKTP